MRRSYWTVLLIPQDGRGAINIRVRTGIIKLLAWFLGGLGTVATVLGLVAVTRAIDLSRISRSERENRELTAEFARTEQLVGALTDTIHSLALHDEQVRLLAGLTPTDPDVLLAGIGGPVTWTDRERRLSETVVGQRALALRSGLDVLVRRANLLSVTYSEAVDSLRTHRQQLLRTPSISPIPANAGWFTSPFSQQRIHPIFHEARPHTGVDVAAAHGTPILAPANGQVIDVQVLAGYGKTVWIDHGNAIRTMYAHCSSVRVEIGEWVARGDTIAAVGSTGISTGPHLHYEVIVNGRRVDPTSFILSGKSIPD